MLQTAASRTEASHPSAEAPSPAPMLGAAWAAFLATRLYLLLFLVPQFSDVQVYFEYAVQGVDLGRTPYKDFAIEYPPAAYWLMSIPRMASGVHVTEDMFADRALLAPLYAWYAFGYRCLMLLLDAAALMLLCAIVRRRNRQWLSTAAWTYVVATASLGHVLYDRLDLGMLVLLLAWAWLWIRGSERNEPGTWRTCSHIALGLSVAFKLLSVVAVPFVLLAEWHSSAGRAWRRASLCALAVALPFAVHYGSAGLSSFAFLKYHGERGIQIESTYASLMLLMQPLGYDVRVEVSHGSANLEGALGGTMGWAAAVLLPAALLACGVWAVRLRGAFNADTAYRLVLFAVLLTLVLSKVLSAQFFVFAIPLAVLLASELSAGAARYAVAAGMVILAVLTTAVMPYLWFSVHPATGAVHPHGLVPDLNLLPCALLVVRNALFAAVVAWLGVRLFGSEGGSGRLSA